MPRSRSGHPKDKDAPLCICGCGKQVRWSKVFRKYNLFVNGHNSIIKGEHHFKKGLLKK